MSSTDYDYDEQGQFFPFFIATMSGLVTFPLLYHLVKPNKDLENTAPRIQSDFQPPQDDIIKRQRQKQIRKQRPVKRIATVVIGLAIMAYMIYLIVVTQRTAPKLYDPYEILGLSRTSDEKAISRHYKRLSMLYHPDKVRPDPAKNETVESLNDHFIELTKAYKALTDEEVRNNYLQYGHPDGKQSFSIGIALPKFIITEGNGKYVLFVYGLVLGMLLPHIVGKWWYGSQKYTKEKVLVESAGNLFQEYRDSINERGIVQALSSGDEFKQLLAGHAAEEGLSRVEKQVVDMLGPKERAFLNEQEDSVRRKTIALLWAYLGRIDLGDPTLETEKFAVAPLALTLNDSFSTIALAFGNLTPFLAAYRTSQHIIQATLPGSSPLLQLPYFSPDVVDAFEGKDKKDHMTLQRFMEIPDAKRRALAVADGLLTEQQYNSAIAVAKQIPRLEVCKAFFKVVGEKFITPSSLVQFVVKARFVPPAAEDVPEVDPADLEDIDPDEDDVDVFLGRKQKSQEGKTEKADRSADPGTGTQKNEESQPIQPPLAHAPFFARDHSPRWNLFLADGNQTKLAVPPFTFTTFNKPIFDAETGKPTYNMQTLKMQFAAPPQTGVFGFVAHLVCDSYSGFDQSFEVELRIEDPAKAVAVNEEDDISEPDEDSIAGQMHMLKTGQAPKPKKKPAQDEEDESSEEDESDTEGEVDDTSATDTETDTDGEN
ncbi:secretory subunit [Ascosphaera atra]|nr:secretory subunit [Ascosphaera atra]